LNVFKFRVDVHGRKVKSFLNVFDYGVGTSSRRELLAC